MSFTTCHGPWILSVNNNSKSFFPQGQSLFFFRLAHLIFCFIIYFVPINHHPPMHTVDIYWLRYFMSALLFDLTVHHSPSLPGISFPAWPRVSYVLSKIGAANAQCPQSHRLLFLFGLQTKEVRFGVCSGTVFFYSNRRMSG